jgi:glutaredoxin
MWRVFSATEMAAQFLEVNEMKVQLLVSETCVPCHQAEKIWREVASDLNLDFTVLDLEGPPGRELAERLKLKTIPAVVVDGDLVAIGVQSREEARELVNMLSD